MPKQAKLHLKVENLPQTDFFGKIDPYFEVWYHDSKLFTSACFKNADNIVDWGQVSFEIPTRAIFQELNIKFYDKDTFSKDDLLLNVELRYPFRNKSYTLGESGAVLKVLDDDGDSDSDLTDGSLASGRATCCCANPRSRGGSVFAIAGWRTFPRPVSGRAICSRACDAGDVQTRYEWPRHRG